MLQLVREVADVMQEFTQSGGVRPFGVSLLVCGCDADGPQLYQVDPSGSYFGWRASAMGKNFINAKTFLEKVRCARVVRWDSKEQLHSDRRALSLPLCVVRVVQRYNEEMELEDAIHTALLTLREGFEGEVRCPCCAVHKCLHALC